MTKDLRALFEPNGVVVAGVSSHPGKFGFVALHNILSYGYSGRVFAVGREKGTVLNHPVLNSIDAVPEGAADLLVLCTPVDSNEEIIRLAATQGIKAIFCATGGYSESGPDGREAERRLIALTEQLGLIFAGPNGQGLISTPAGLCAQIVAPLPTAGRIAIASQSGNLVSSFLNYSNQTGIGISRSVSVGNAATLGIVDYLEWFADDLETTVVLCYMEGIKDGREFFKRIQKVTQRLPVIILKGGTTASGKRAAVSHTGSLATNDRIFDGMARQAGIIRANDIESAFDAAATFATQPLPSGNRVVVLSTAGGWGVISADAIASHSNLNLTPLPTDLEATINGLLPPRWSHNNPVDIAGGETRDTIPDLLEATVAHPDVDAVVQLGLGIQGNTASLARSGPFFPDHGLDRIVEFHERQERRYSEVADSVSRTYNKPVLLASELAVTQPDNPLVQGIRTSGRLCYPSGNRAVTALGHLVHYMQWKHRRD